MAAAKKKKRRCRHCNKKKYIVGRGLCKPCYSQHRDEYDTMPLGRPPKATAAASAADLEIDADIRAMARKKGLKLVRVRCLGPPRAANGYVIPEHSFLTDDPAGHRICRKCERLLESLAHSTISEHVLVDQRRKVGKAEYD